MCKDAPNSSGHGEQDPYMLTFHLILLLIYANDNNNNSENNNFIEQLQRREQK